LVWELVTRFQLLSPIVLPPAGSVGMGLLTLLRSDWFYQHVWLTGLETAVGFTLGSVLAMSLAVLLHYVPLLRRVLYPFILTLQLTPSVVLAPIFIVWFGFGIESRIVVALMTAFFVVLVSALTGLDAVEENALLLMSALCASRGQVFRMLTLPTALPYVFSGLKAGITLALIGAIVGEFIAGRAGLGVLLTQFGFALKQDMVFATVAVIATLGMTLFGMVVLAERKVVWWRSR
jgi:NitT/TauT family transport system permease protein